MLDSGENVAVFQCRTVGPLHRKLPRDQTTNANKTFNLLEIRDPETMGLLYLADNGQLIHGQSGDYL
jgi:hypothetical protein